MTADITSSIFVYEQNMGMTKEENSPFEYKEIMVETPDTADTGDIFTITLSDYGITNMKSITGWIHSTRDSVVVLEEPTTQLSGSDVEVTLGGSAANNQKRVYIIGGY